ncbi:hypothetical protein [Bifidobacterium biavatii]|uniref:TcdA-E operon negative regulator n=1 Tax=Bifidobacterium biavatii DSM 23969 TaxID=1437608 RepID=A0A087A131_9BIFI|nr:hypothetical protein [Bifidobacterium biavatii]KFI52481.1 tcdA-E operon negative regulator [Bifidobacterium biavatii DSM 23969]
MTDPNNQPASASNDPIQMPQSNPVQPMYGQYAQTSESPVNNAQAQSANTQPLYAQAAPSTQHEAPYVSADQYPQGTDVPAAMSTNKKPARTITLKLWQLVMALCVSIVVILMIIAMVIGNMGTNQSGNNGAQPEASQSEQSGSGQEDEQVDDSSNDQEEESPTILGIEADYDGSTAPGTEINDSTQGITVEVTYSDGKTTTLFSGWTVTNPGTLEEGKTQEFTVEYEGFDTTFTVTVDESDETFKASTQDIPYEDLARNPDSNKGKRIHFRGKIVQVIEGDYISEYRISVKQGDYGIWDSSSIIYVSHATDSNNRFLEDDIVEFWGTSNGTITYQSTLGGNITIPSALAKIMQLSQ